MENTRNLDKITVIAFGVLVFYIMLAQGGYYGAQTGIALIVTTLLLCLRVKKVRISNHYVFGASFGLLVFGLISIVFRSDNLYNAFTEFMKYVLFFTAILFYSTLTEESKALLMKVFYYSFLVLAIFGLIGYLPSFNEFGLVTKIGGRLQSFIQYANTTALIMIFGIILSVKYWIETKKLCYIACLVIFVTSLLLTGSRTAFIILLFALIVSLGFFVMKGDFKRKKLFFVVLLLSVTVIVLLLSLLSVRLFKISLFEPTFVERIITYYDALKIIILDIYNFTFGLGMGDWQEQQFIHQSAPYYVKQIHNAYLQIALDSGVFSALCFAGILILSIVDTIKVKKYWASLLLGVFAFYCLLDIHFNFSYVILFVGLSISDKVSAAKIAKLSSKTVTIKRVFLGLLSIVLIMFTLSEFTEKNYDLSLKLNPLNLNAKYEKALSEFSEDEQIALFKEINISNRYNQIAIEKLSQIYLEKDDFVEAYKHAFELIKLNTFNREYQDFVKYILEKALEQKSISKIDYDKYNAECNVLINERNKNINPLYRYINAEMEY